MKKEFIKMNTNTEINHPLKANVRLSIDDVTELNSEIYKMDNLVSYIGSPYKKLDSIIEQVLRVSILKTVNSLIYIRIGMSNVYDFHKFSKLINRAMYKEDIKDDEKWFSILINNVSFKDIYKDYVINELVNIAMCKCSLLNGNNEVYRGSIPKIRVILTTKYKKLLQHIVVSFFYANRKISADFTIGDISDKFEYLDKKKFNALLYAYFCTRSKFDHYRESHAIAEFILNEFNTNMARYGYEPILTIVRDVFSVLGSYTIEDIPKEISDKDVLKAYPILEKIPQTAIDFILAYGGSRIKQLFGFILKRGAQIYDR